MTLIRTIIARNSQWFLGILSKSQEFLRIPRNWGYFFNLAVLRQIPSNLAAESTDADSLDFQDLFKENIIWSYQK